MPLVLITTRFFTLIFTLIGNGRFLEPVMQILGKKCRQKMAILSFLGHLGEIDSDSETVWTCICTINIVPQSALPIFQVVIRSG